MTEIRLHGRFGQPVGKIARAIGQYALKEGKRVQVFDAFAAFRPGAPTYSVVRIDKVFIRERAANNTQPDHVLVLDNSLLGVVDVTKGLKKNGTIWAKGLTAANLGEKGSDFHFTSLDPYFTKDQSVEESLIVALKDEGIL